MHVILWYCCTTSSPRLDKLDVAGVEGSGNDLDPVSIRVVDKGNVLLTAEISISLFGKRLSIPHPSIHNFPAQPVWDTCGPVTFTRPPFAANQVPPFR